MAGKELLYFDVIDSTNLEAKRRAEEGAPEGLLIVADKQVAGRGRRGRSWESPAGANIFMTLLLRPCLLYTSGADEAVLRIKSLEAFERAADGKATKIIIPSEIQGIAGLAASVKELVSDK